MQLFKKYIFRSDAQKNNLKMAAIDLINRRAEEFKASDVLNKLPKEWALSTIAPALMKMSKSSIHKVSIILARILTNQSNIRSGVQFLFCLHFAVLYG